jgi:quercetin dioxygenase-like cupin family protein
MYRYTADSPGSENRGGNMVTIIDLTSEMAKLMMLHGRTPTTPPAARARSAARLAGYRDGGIFTSKSAGRGAWERHPEGEEIVQIVDGSAVLHLVTEEGPQSVTLAAGMLAIVPQGTWHRLDYPEGVAMLTVTPQPSEYVREDVADPRTVAAQTAIVPQAPAA